MADDRVGYFVTALKDFSKKENEDDRFVRYINRWNLEKADPSAEMSTPKEPIVFWLEKTIPFKYRKPIRDGILEWNKAFAKAGYYDAIEVRQQPDDAPWDPGDIRYNTFRWITAGAGFAMGPSRVNPTTGPNSGCRHYLRLRLPASLEAGVRNVHAGQRRDADRRADRPGRVPSRDQKKMPAYMQEMHGVALRLQHAGRHVAPVGARSLGDGIAQAKRSRSWRS